MADPQPASVRGDDHGEGACGPLSQIVQEQRGRSPPRGNLDDAQRIGVHPAALELRDRQIESGERVYDVRPSPVGTDTDALNGCGSRRQYDGRVLQGICVDNADNRGKLRIGGNSVGQKVRRHQALLIRGQCQATRLPDYRYLSDNARIRMIERRGRRGIRPTPLGEVDDSNAMTSLARYVQSPRPQSQGARPLIRLDTMRYGRSRRIDHRHRTGCSLRNVQPAIVRRQDQASRLRVEADLLSDPLGSRIGHNDAGRGAVSHVEPGTVRRQCQQVG